MSKKFLKIGLSIVIIWGLFFGLNSCNEDPTLMGSDLLLDTIQLFPISTSTAPLIKKVGSYRQKYSHRDRGVYHVGIYEDLKALSVLQFEEIIRQDSTYDYLLDYDENQLTSCKLRIPIGDYILGDEDKSNALSFKVYDLTNDKSVNESWISIASNTIGPSTYPLVTYQNAIDNYVDMSYPVAEFTANIEKTDSYIEIELDKSMMLEWFKIWYEDRKADSYPDSTYFLKTWGLAFIPDEGSSVIRSFTSTSNVDDIHTEIQIFFNNPDGERDSLISKEFVNMPYYSAQEYTEGEMQIQGGVDTRGILYYDLSEIPEFAAIHTAQLDLSINWDKSYYGNNGPDSSLVGRLAYKEKRIEGTFNEDDINLMNSDFQDRAYSGSIDSIDGNSYRFTRIPPLLESLKRDGPVEFFIIHPDGHSNHYQELNRLVFYGVNDPDSSLRPRLRIIYSTRPDFEK